MQFSEQWLRRWVNPKLTTKALCEKLTTLGLEVDSVTHILPQVEKVVVGHVVEREKHPDADRLSVCKVNVGSEILDIVCGAANVRKDLKVAVVMVGGELPGGFKIKKANLRGAPSHGMICSAKELGLTEESDGILELPDDAPIGKAIVEYLDLDDHIIDIDLTPNRGDCLSIEGIARDLAAATKAKFTPIKINKTTAKIKDQLTIELKNPAACPRYCGRIIKNIDPNAKSPIWLKECLRRIGLRDIHPVVDVLNCVMFELGQPMHAFDLAKLGKKISVRFAKANEKIKLLDENLVTLDDKSLVIADDKNAVALAGVMGGFDSAVGDGTVSIFLESAFFTPKTIARTAKKLGLSTDSSFRFERGVDFELPKRALERATELLLKIVGGEAGPITEAVDTKHLPKRAAVKLDAKDIERLLGVTVAANECERILKALGMSVKKLKAGWNVIPPSYRFDIEQPADLVEEVARIVGYEQIPMVPLKGDLTIKPRAEANITIPRIIQQMMARDYNEAITYSFVEEKLQKLLSPNAQAIPLTNPLSQDLAVMRTSLWPGLIAAMQFNLNRHAARVRLFEMGHTYQMKQNGIEEVGHIAGVAIGPVHKLNWADQERPVDFFDMKGDLETLLAATSKAFEWRKTDNPVLHPGQSAELRLNGRCVGYMGALHPAIVQQLGFASTPYLFDIELEALEQGRLPSYEKISKFPTSSRDIAIVVSETVPVADISGKISDFAGNLLNKVEIFDIYQGKGIDDGCKSVALGLTFEDPSRTLQDDEVNVVMERIVKGLEDAFDAKLRI